MQADAALQMADRISDWAYSFGLPVADSGCTPNVVVVATDDGDRTAVELVASRPREFRTGAAFSDRGSSALRRFQNSGQPIRWWHISAVVNPETGRMAGRLPGHEPIDLTQSHMKKPSDFASRSMTIVPSRIRAPDRDELQQVIIVFDTKALDSADFGQVIDYVALISLINIYAEGDTRGRDTILNLFDSSSAQPETLTTWDRALVGSIYGSEQDQMGSRGNIASVAALMARDLASPTP